MNINTNFSLLTITLWNLIILSCACLVMISCDKDEDPVTPGGISLTPGATSYEGVRGSDVNVSINAAAEDGIALLSATPEGGSAQMISVPADTKTATANITFPIPGDALLGATYKIDVEITDKDGDKNSVELEVLTIGVLPEPPVTYEFTRDGSSTVSYDGQNERLDMVQEIKSYLAQGDGGAVLSAQVLNDAYANTGDNGNGFFSFTSTKQLKDKTFQPDQDEQFMESLFAAAESASMSGAVAAEGTAGLLVRENSGNTVLVDADGREFTQLIEKGLMGTVMYNQIFNTYFTDARTGDDVENTALKEGANYADMEHHWDEAFGYWNPPLDFSSNWPQERSSEDRFWSHYSNTVDPLLGTNERIMQGFIVGRTAIVNNDLVTKNEKRTEISSALEEVAAATAVHYINSALSNLNEAKTGELFHVLSEAWAFVNALRYTEDRLLSLEEIEKIQNENFGADGNFWKVNTVGLNEAKQTLVSAYPSLESVKDDL